MNHQSEFALASKPKAPAPFCVRCRMRKLEEGKREPKRKYERAYQLSAAGVVLPCPAVGLLLRMGTAFTLNRLLSSSRQQTGRQSSDPATFSLSLAAMEGWVRPLANTN